MEFESQFWRKILLFNFNNEKDTTNGSIVIINHSSKVNHTMSQRVILILSTFFHSLIIPYRPSVHLQ